MSRSKQYQRLLNSRRWRELRAWKLQKNPLCERCIREGQAAGVPDGYITAAVDVHHRIPCETARDNAEMERLTFDPSNLESLCVPCHIKTHQQNASHTKQAHAERTDQALERWRAANSSDQPSMIDKMLQSKRH